MLRRLETWLREGRENERTRGIGVDMALISVKARLWKDPRLVPGDPTSVAVTGDPSLKFSQAISVRKFGRDLLLLDVLLKGEWREPKRAFVPERQLTDEFRGFDVWRVDEPAAQYSENNHKLMLEGTSPSGTLFWIFFRKFYNPIALASEGKEKWVVRHS